jgi:hypothetical protein
MKPEAETKQNPEEAQRIRVYRCRLSEGNAKTFLYSDSKLNIIIKSEKYYY